MNEISNEISDVQLSVLMTYFPLTLITSYTIVENAFQSTVYFDLVFQTLNNGQIVFR